MKNNKLKIPKVTIIIINWNGLNDTIKCLDSLKKIKYKPIEIIVVDNGSKNKEEISVISEKYPEIRTIVNKENLGFCKANNQGVEIALKNKTDYILFLNNDTKVHPEFLNILINYFEKNKKIGALSPIIKYSNSDRVWFGGVKFSLPLGGFILNNKSTKLNKDNKAYDTDYISGCCFLTKSSILKEIGMFDESYFAYYEDADLSFRIKKKDYQLKIVPNSIIEHEKSASAGERGSKKLSPLQSYLFARNAIIFGKKNLKGIKLLIFLANQFTLKLFISLYNCHSLKSAKKYLLGLSNGIRR